MLVEGWLYKQTFVIILVFRILSGLYLLPIALNGKFNAQHATFAL